MNKDEARVRLIALAETTPKGVQRDALVMGANALIDDIANQWLAEHDAQIRADERAKIIAKAKNEYADACNMCTKTDCDVCAINNFIEQLKTIIKEQK